jgi:hypothetical protein
MRDQSKLSENVKYKIDNYAMIWLGKRGVVQTILEDYRGQDIEAEIKEIQQFLDADIEAELPC